MTGRWDETWHRLREWTNGQGPSERLAAQILAAEGYTSIDPSHPLGGPDGGKDALVRRDGEPWIMAAYFPRGQQSFQELEHKLASDCAGASTNNAVGVAFVTNQEVSLANRVRLEHSVEAEVDLFHLERTTGILDRPEMAGVREQFLSIPAPGSGSRNAPASARDILDAAQPPPGAPDHRMVYDGMLLLRVVALPATSGVRDPDAGHPGPALETAAVQARAIAANWPEQVSLLAKRLAEGWAAQAPHKWGAGWTSGDPDLLARTPTAAVSYLTRGGVLCVDRTWPTGIYDDAGALAFYAAREPEIAAEAVVALALAGALLGRLTGVGEVDVATQIAAAPSGKALVSSERAVSRGRFGEPAGYLPKPVVTDVQSHYLDNARVSLEQLGDPYRSVAQLIGPWLATFRSDDLFGRLRAADEPSRRRSRGREAG